MQQLGERGLVKSDRDSSNSVADPSHAARGARWSRPVLFILAWMFLAIGVVGVFLPLLPGTLFLILAGACFTRSSPRFEAWLLDHPRFGPPVRAWRARSAIPRKAKIIACLSLTASWLLLVAMEAPMIATASSLAVFVAVAIYLVTRP